MTEKSVYRTRVCERNYFISLHYDWNRTICQRGYFFFKFFFVLPPVYLSFHCFTRPRPFLLYRPVVTGSASSKKIKIVTSRNSIFYLFRIGKISHCEPLDSFASRRAHGRVASIPATYKTIRLVRRDVYKHGRMCITSKEAYRTKNPTTTSDDINIFLVDECTTLGALFVGSAVPTGPIRSRTFFVDVKKSEYKMNYTCDIVSRVMPSRTYCVQRS